MSGIFSFNRVICIISINNYNINYIKIFIWQIKHVYNLIEFTTVHVSGGTNDRNRATIMER